MNARLGFAILVVSLMASLCSADQIDDDEDCRDGHCERVMPPSFRCELFREYQECRQDCVEVCYEGKVETRCAPFCESGCFCVEGLVEARNGKCIPKEICLTSISVASPVEEDVEFSGFDPTEGFERVEAQDIYHDEEVIARSKRQAKCNDVDTPSGCRSGARCDDEAGMCVRRLDCPVPAIPRLKAGCIFNLVPDERDCPMPKITCSSENLKCGETQCEKGYECNPSTLQCVFRHDCPRVEFPKEEGCTDELVLNDWDCLVPKRTCVTQPALDETTAEPKPPCPKNAEWRECSNVCPAKSCANIDFKSPCFSLRCGPPACVCKEDHVLLDHQDLEKGCVRREICVRMKSASRTTRSLL